MTEAEIAWLPDGVGLPDYVDVQMPVHLRLTAPDGHAARGACDRGLGEWWSGIASEVTCDDCKEWRSMPEAEKVGLTDEERQTLDERVAGGWWGYYIHFD